MDSGISLYPNPILLCAWGSHSNIKPCSVCTVHGFKTRLCNPARDQKTKNMPTRSLKSTAWKKTLFSQLLKAPRATLEAIWVNKNRIQGREPSWTLQNWRNCSGGLPLWMWRAWRWEALITGRAGGLGVRRTVKHPDTTSFPTKPSARKKTKFRPAAWTEDMFLI